MFVLVAVGTPVDLVRYPFGQLAFVGTHFLAHQTLVYAQGVSAPRRCPECSVFRPSLHYAMCPIGHFVQCWTAATQALPRVHLPRFLSIHLQQVPTPNVIIGCVFSTSPFGLVCCPVTSFGFVLVPSWLLFGLFVCRLRSLELTPGGGRSGSCFLGAFWSPFGAFGGPFGLVSPPVTAGTNWNSVLSLAMGS